MFTAGIPILVNSGLFSLGGCMVRVVGRETTAPFLGQYLSVIVWHILVATVRPCRGPHFGSHFEVNMRHDALEQVSSSRKYIDVYQGHLVLWGRVVVVVRGGENKSINTPSTV
jgi:hypothetical protein